MKIGIDARLWNETGVGRYIRNLVSNLYKIDHENEYVLFCIKGDVSSIKSEVLSTKWKIVISDIKWHSIEEQLKLPAILNKENLDLMHFTYFSIPVLYKRPFIVTIHDLIINHFQTGKASTLPLPFYYIKRLGYKAVLNQSVKNAKKIIVPLNSTKNDLVENLKIESDKIVVTYEGVDEEILNPKSEIRNKNNSKFSTLNSQFFLYVGNAYPHKNLEVLIQAFRKVVSIKYKVSRIDSEKLKLILIGKDDYFYKKLAIKLQNEGIANIEILHDVTDTELQQFYRNALAVISPSLMEGFGLVPLEALANEAFVIISDIPAHREVCRNAAIYFDPRSMEELQKRLSEVINSYKDSNNKVNTKVAIEHLKMFSWKKMAEQTLKVYDQFEK